MTAEVLVLATALQSQALGLRDARAEYLARAIFGAAGGDLNEQAALVVTLVREGGTRPTVERCMVPGLGGWGAFQLAGDTVPFEVACGPIASQARAARRVLVDVKHFDALAPERGFQGYLGATSIRPEVRRRTALFAQVRWQLENLACR